MASHILILSAVTAVAAASSAAGQLELTYTTADGGIWQAVRTTSGTWGTPTQVNGVFGNLGTITAIAATSCGPSQTQLIFATREGGLWHTVQQPGGAWTLPIGDVHGPIGDPGVVVAVSAAAAAASTSAFMFATLDGGLWHTMRNPDGTWTGLGNVKGQIGDQGAMSVAAAASSAVNQVQFLIA